MSDRVMEEGAESPKKAIDEDEKNKQLADIEIGCEHLHIRDLMKLNLDRA